MSPPLIERLIPIYEILVSDSPPISTITYVSVNYVSSTGDEVETCDIIDVSSAWVNIYCACSALFNNDNTSINCWSCCRQVYLTKCSICAKDHVINRAYTIRNS